MAKRWNRMETWLTLGAVGVGGVLTALLAMFAYMAATPPLHPQPDRVPSATRADPSPRWAPAVERGRAIVRAHLVEHSLPGLSVAVGAGGDIVWAEGFGFADLDNGDPVGPDTRFRIGTASKALTSAAVGLLLERDRLSLDEPIRTYVPEYPAKEWPVTLRQLMAHQAGLRTDAGDEGPLYSQECERPVDALPHFADRALLFEPGTQYRYSNYGWVLVSAAIEAAADQPFMTFMHEQVFEPLGMHDTAADAAAKPLPDAATFYFPRFAADPRYGLHLMRPIHLSCYAGASAFLSTPSDLVRFALALKRGTLLEAQTVQLLQASQRLPSGEETGYGLGWDRERITLAGHETHIVGHDGDVLGGMAASLWIVPGDIVVAVASNISYAGTADLAVKVAEAFTAHAGGIDR